MILFSPSTQRTHHLTRARHHGHQQRMQAASTPRVSILLPAYDAEGTLPAALRSILRQAEPRWECVIVDDGSSDATLACARTFAQRDARFIAVSTPHRGLVAALNTGIEHCRADIVARMDADDLMHRHRLSRQLRALDAEPLFTAVGCHVRLFPRATLGDGLRAYERWLNSVDDSQRVRAEAFVECPVAHPTLMIRRNALTELGYRDTGWPEDYDLILRLITRGDAIGVVAQRLLCWRNGPHRLTWRGEQYGLDRLTACKAAFLASHFLAATDTYILWGFGDTGRALRRALLQHGKRPSHVVEVHPGRLGNVIHGAPVVGYEQLPQLPRRPVVVSVAGEGPRRQIRDAMTAMGFREPQDFVCAA
jgi:GT2 family glycosyltransferase